MVQNSWHSDVVQLCGVEQPPHGVRQCGSVIVPKQLAAHREGHLFSLGTSHYLGER